MGLIDVALVNMYVLHTESYAKAKKKPLTHAEWRRSLSSQLIEVGQEVLDDAHQYGVEEEDEQNIEPVHVPTKNQHYLVRTKEMRGPGTVRAQLKQRSCRVCAWLRVTGKIPRNRDTTTFCKKCTDEKERSEPSVFLCGTPRAELGGLSCYAYYHDVWKCKPPTMKSQLVLDMTKKGKTTKNKRKRDTSDIEEENSAASYSEYSE